MPSRVPVVGLVPAGPFGPCRIGVAVVKDHRQRPGHR